MSKVVGPRVAVVLKGWPRLSETFIAQEIAGLEARGIALEIWSLRHPTDKVRHPVHDRLRGRVAAIKLHRMTRGSLRWTSHHTVRSGVPVFLAASAV